MKSIAIGSFLLVSSMAWGADPSEKKVVRYDRPGEVCEIVIDNKAGTIHVLVESSANRFQANGSNLMDVLNAHCDSGLLQTTYTDLPGQKWPSDAEIAIKKASLPVDVSGEVCEIHIDNRVNSIELLVESLGMQTPVDSSNLGQLLENSCDPNLIQTVYDDIDYKYPTDDQIEQRKQTLAL